MPIPTCGCAAPCSIAPATGLSLSPVAPSNATGNFTKIAQRLPVKIVLDATPAGAAAARGHVGRGRGRDHAPARRPRNEPVENTAPGPDLGAVEPGRLRRGTGLPGASSAAAAMARCRRGRPASAPVAQPVNDAWWDSFGDPELSALVAEASAANPDILIAYERLRQSRAALRVSEADGLPKLGANASYRRGRTARPACPIRPDAAASPRSTCGRPASMPAGNWTCGAACGARSNRPARCRRPRWKRSAASCCRCSRETASHYIRLRGAQNQLAVLRQTLDNANRNLALTRLRQREGVATELDVSQADAQAAAIGRPCRRWRCAWTS